jgi:SAM-dependent methyltransferase
MVSSSNKFEKKCSKGLCRSCGHIGLKPILDLGRMPLSDRLLTDGQIREPEGKYPLEVAYCPECSLVQILETVPPEKLFCENYPYYSSFSDTLLEHSRRNVLSLIESRGLNSDSFVVELASNDGYLLKNYVESGIHCLGIDPAEGPARAAEKIGIPTLCDFFSQELAERLANEGRRADVIHANNVLAHVADTNGFVEGIRILLKGNGVGVIEVPYVRDLIDNCQFDTIYHEHLCYFSVTSLDKLFRRHRLFLNGVTRLSIHGGSLRLYVEPREQVGDSVRELLAQETKAGVDQYSYYIRFRRDVESIRKSVQELLYRLKKKGKRIAAYGAAAKGAIMLNYIGAAPDLIDFVVDRNIHKQDKYMPGVHIPICDPCRLLQDMPDYVIILSWNFKDEILSQQSTFREKGGKFIIPIPKPVVV